MNNNQKGLYRSSYEKDSCGIASIVNLNNKSDHKTILDAMSALENMEHRGGRSADQKTGDGAGIMISMPHEFFREIFEKAGKELPAYGYYGVCVFFFPKQLNQETECKRKVNLSLNQLGLSEIHSREVPVDNSHIGEIAKINEPTIKQYFITSNDNLSDLDLERKLFKLRKILQNRINNENFYTVSASSRKLIYKGQLRTMQLRKYFKDLENPKLKSTFAIIHSRFSTNTIPKWGLAQPFSSLAHNGEINTINGNITKMKSKEDMMESKYFTREELQQIFPICRYEDSDSSNLNEIIDLLILNDRSIAKAFTMVIPEAWQEDVNMPKHKKAYYDYHSSSVEAWDGPAAICFSDGRYVGAVLDRNGLRPCRYIVTKDNRLIISSEAGSFRISQKNILKKGRLEPGKMLLADLTENRIASDKEIKDKLSYEHDYDKWLSMNRILFSDIEESKIKIPLIKDDEIIIYQNNFGYTYEEMNKVLFPMGIEGKEPTASMGVDIPLPVFSEKPQNPSNYLKQLFAQVSNPPIDSIREKFVMSTSILIGRHYNILEDKPKYCRQIKLDTPFLTPDKFAKLLYLDDYSFYSAKIDILFKEEESLKEGLERISKEALEACMRGVEIIILSDRNIKKGFFPIPVLFATAAVQQSIVDEGLRSKISIVLETGEVFDIHGFASLLGYGASAIYPYLAYDSFKFLLEDNLIKSITNEQAIKNYIKSLNYGLLKIMSKMGISTLQSYQSAQIFETIGLSQEIVDMCFRNTPARVHGIDFDDFERDIRAKTRYIEDKDNDDIKLNFGGIYQWKKDGEEHIINPTSIHLLQKSTSLNDYTLYKKYADFVNSYTQKPFYLRHIMDFSSEKKQPIPIKEVESVDSIIKRFSTGAMSFGSLSYEAHTSLAIAMNRIGAKSNSGEGGESSERYKKLPNGDSMRSAIKQIASGRFGVTAEYLNEADEIQIKIAQGAKPGEGGQLPGFKVDAEVGRVRHSIPGVELISPPPHHDIYSIEDLAQLIFDLKNANPVAKISVKLVARAGVGTIANGVVKAGANTVIIAGGDGGTGASPIGSLRNAGLPWELGLAETNQTLVRHNSRSQVKVQADGKIMTGRDVAIATLLGADEWGISTMALVVQGCVMMRKCHLNTCPVGITTQDKELRSFFTGNPDHLVNYFRFVTEELREIMASLGFRTVDEMVGRSDYLEKAANIPSYIKDIDISEILFKETPLDIKIKQSSSDRKTKHTLDDEIIEISQKAIDNGADIIHSFDIYNTDRTTGALLASKISKKYGYKGLPKGSINISFKGSAGQSFGAFINHGISFHLEGDANDYLAKGISGGTISVFPDKEADFIAEDNIIIGNVALYGATSGEVYIRGIAGERFCVRNSGAYAVAEGLGDHGCEYMTGGRALILGRIGRNFGAGMSGGIAYIWGNKYEVDKHINKDMVIYDSLLSYDKETIEYLLNNHFEKTSSILAKKLLDKKDEWDTEILKIIPPTYKDIIEKTI